MELSPKLCSVQAQLSIHRSRELLLRHSEYHRGHGEAGAAARKHGIKQAQSIAGARTDATVPAAVLIHMVLLCVCMYEEGA